LRTARKKFARFNAFSALVVFLSFSVSHLSSAGTQSSPTPSPSPSFTSTRSTDHGTVDATLSSNQVADGSLIVVTAHFSKSYAGPLNGKFEDENFIFFPMDEGKNTFEAIFGVPHSHTAGPAEVTVSGDGFQKTISFNVVDGNYKSETLKVENSRVNPPKKVMKRILAEMKETGAIYATVTPQKYWNGPFKFPITSKVTSPFGTKRVYNGQLKGYHGGLDLKAPDGTPIHAAAPGKVVLAKNLYYSGNTVILDHGYGLLTLYFHMTKIKAKLGETVNTGDLLGLSGHTGRVTGPHLHWQAVIGKVKVNPMGLIEVLK
jgi:murein DD-endopeptidase MepM/ murein hydrolase activator NlpD